MIWLHTYAQRMVPAGRPSREVPQGKARCVKGIPGTKEEYPEKFSYEDTPQLLRVGKGEFASVSKAVFEFSVSGLFVVKSWLRYRTKAGAGKSSSLLDEIRPDVWTAQMTQELLELLWVLEATVELQPVIGSLLKDICSGKLFEAKELPKPSKEECQPPKAVEDQPENVQGDLPGVVVETRSQYKTVDRPWESQPAKSETKHLGRHKKRNAEAKTRTADEGKCQVYCPKCKKVLPQTPEGDLEEKRSSIFQTYICSACKRKNRVETRVR